MIGSFFLSYGNIEDIHLDLRHKYINVIKMSIYVFVEFVISFNTKLEKDYKLILLETKVFIFVFIKCITSLLHIFNLYTY